MNDGCPPNREWLDWAIDRWLDMKPGSPHADALLTEIFREQAKRLVRRAPRRLRSRDVLYRRHPETLRNAIWHRMRKALRARLRELGNGDLALRSVPAARQLTLGIPAGVDLGEGGNHG